jgi:hypothetical protein
MGRGRGLAKDDLSPETLKRSKNGNCTYNRAYITTPEIVQLSPNIQKKQQVFDSGFGWSI